LPSGHTGRKTVGASKEGREAKTIENGVKRVEIEAFSTKAAR
jgi:hypothetical protein